MTSYGTSHGLVIINPGASNETRFETGVRAPLLMEALATRREGAQAPKMSFKALDNTGRLWRNVSFGSSVKFEVNGVLAFSGVVCVSRRDVVGGAVVVDCDCVGRSYLLYSKTVLADKQYLTMDTAAIAADLITLNGGGVLTGTNIVGSTGTLVSEFTVNVNDNLGQVFERLAKLDGYSFDVDENSDVHYFAVSAVSQLVVNEEDIDGAPGDHYVEVGVQPPRNVVRIKGSLGYSDTSRQESLSAYYNLDASTKRFAQSFLAETDTLSAVSLYMNRTQGTNKPGSLGFTIQTSTYVIADDRDTATNVAVNTYDMKTLDDRMAFAWTPSTTYGDHFLKQLKFVMVRTGTPSTTVSVEVRADNAGQPGALQQTISVAGSVISGSNYRFTYTSTTDAVPLTRNVLMWFVVLPPSNTTSSNYWTGQGNQGAGGEDGYKNSIDGGATWVNTYGKWYLGANVDRVFQTSTANPSGTVVEFSDDISFSPTDVALPPTWSTAKTYALPDKLRLAPGTRYWLVVSDAAATASKYWALGYYATSDLFSPGTCMISTSSGASWSKQSYDAVFRLYWSQEEVDVTVTDSASVALYGTWYYEDTAPEITNSADATLVANEILSRYAAPASRMTLVLKECRPELTTRSVVTIKRPLLDINGDYELAEVRTEIKGRRAQTTLIIGTPEFNAARALNEVRKKVTT